MVFSDFLVIRGPNWTDQQLREAVPKAKSIRTVISILGLSANDGGTNLAIKTRIRELNLDTRHFTGQLWNKGKKVQTPPRYKYTLEELLVINPLNANLLKNKCALCGMPPFWKKQTSGVTPRPY